MTLRDQRRTRRTRAATAAATLLTSAAPAFAGTVTWTGNSSPANTEWTDPANWGGTVPDDIARFNNTAPTAANARVTVGADQVLNQINFNNPAVALAVAGSTFTLNGAPPNAAGERLAVVRAGANTTVQTVASELRLAADLTFQVAGGGAVVFDGAIGQTPGGPKGLSKTGNTYVELNGNNTFTGPVSVLQNNAILGHDNALGLGTSAVRVGRTDPTSTNQAHLLTKTDVRLARDVIVRSGSTGGARLGGEGGQTFTVWSGTIRLERNVELTGGTAGGAVARFDGDVVDAAAGDDGGNQFVSSNVTKVQGGRVKLNGPNNTYSGTTTVAGGSLWVNGVLGANDAAVTVNGGATLGGRGTINRPVTVLAGGAIAPGDVDIGTLTVGPGKVLTLGDGAALRAEIGPTPAAADRAVADLVAFGATLDVRLIPKGGVASAADAFPLLTWAGADPAALPALTVDPASGYTGTLGFVGAADGQPGGSLVATSLVPVAVPEPAALGPAAAAGLLLARRRRPRGRAANLGAA